MHAAMTVVYLLLVGLVNMNTGFKDANMDTCMGLF